MVEINSCYFLEIRTDWESAYPSDQVIVTVLQKTWLGGSFFTEMEWGWTRVLVPHAYGSGLYPFYYSEVWYHWLWKNSYVGSPLPKEGVNWSLIMDLTHQ